MSLIHLSGEKCYEGCVLISSIISIKPVRGKAIFMAV
jgi:hypothetical protein